MKKEIGKLAPDTVMYVSDKVCKKEYGLEIDEQIRMIKRYVDSKGFQSPEYFVEEDSHDYKVRDVFEKMLEYFEENPKIKILLVENANRLYRNKEDVERIKALKLEVHFIGDGRISSEEREDGMEGEMREAEVLLASQFSGRIFRVGFDLYRVGLEYDG